MVSITSVISFILLLATCAYSAPIEQQYETSTITNEFTSGKTIVEREDKLTSDDESTTVPTIHKERSLELKEKRTIEEFLLSTIESSTEFNRKAIPPVDSHEDVETSTHVLSKKEIESTTNVHEDVETSTHVLSKKEIESTTNVHEDVETSTHGLSKKEIELTTNVHEDVETSTHGLSKKEIELTTNVQPLTSSVDSFGKVTGLLHDDQTSTPEHETTDRPIIKTEKITKTVLVIPGKVTETKVIVNQPNKKSIVTPPVDENQLNQEHKRRDCINNKC